MSSGMTHSTQPVTTIRVRRRRPVTRGSRRPRATALRRMGATRANRSGTPTRSLTDVVAVEADEREQLLQHLQMRDGDDQQQELAGGGHVDAGQGQHEDRVEVQAAEVGAQPAGADEPVGVGDVGEERRPDQVDADADPRRAARRRSGSRPRARTRGTWRRPRTGRARRAGPPGHAAPAGAPRPARGRRTASSPRPRRWRPRPRSRATGTAAAAASRRRSPHARAAACPAPAARAAGWPSAGRPGRPRSATMPRGSSLAVIR